MKKNRIISGLNNLSLESTIRKDAGAHIEYNILSTNRGEIHLVYHLSELSKLAVMWVGGAGGGLDGPAAGLYPRMAEKLVLTGIASLRLDFRYPNFLEDCIQDVLIGIQYLKKLGFQQVI